MVLNKKGPCRRDIFILLAADRFFFVFPISSPSFSTAIFHFFKRSLWWKIQIAVKKNAEIKRQETSKDLYAFHCGLTDPPSFIPTFRPVILFVNIWRNSALKKGNLAFKEKERENRRGIKESGKFLSGEIE